MLSDRFAVGGQAHDHQTQLEFPLSPHLADVAGIAQNNRGGDKVAVDMQRRGYYKPRAV